MLSIHRTRALTGAFAVTFAAAACSDAITAPPDTGTPHLAAIKFWEAGSSVAWNQTARELIAARAVASPIAQVRIMTYLSVAQYNAVVAAEDAKDAGNHASPAAAAAGASLIVLKSFFPLDAALLDARIAAQRSAMPLPGARKHDFAAGEVIGRAIGDLVVAYAASDNTNLTAPPPNPGGAGYWTGTNSIRGLYGARTFALTSGSQFRPGPPPAFGSAEFTAALAEIRAFSDGLTSDELALAQLWAPQGPAYLNGLAAEEIVRYRRNERDAARIFALANMAGFDVANACFDAKFAYYLIRPSQADPAIQLPVGLPNHPSYPSGHSCFTAAYGTVLAKTFPAEAQRYEAMVIEAGISRMYAGLHYRFDCEVGQQLGRDVANWVLGTAPAGHAAIPLD
ncbi:MAG TPA: vanadium-dependent haloperoxidase [Gemmatimonadaceae bacterium]